MDEGGHDQHHAPVALPPLTAMQVQLVNVLNMLVYRGGGGRGKGRGVYPKYL